VAEVGYLLGKRLGSLAEVAFAESLVLRELDVAPVEAMDWSRILELVAKYADLRLGIVDASLIALAERLHASTIATLDHRHFGAVQPAHLPRFELAPALGPVGSASF